MITITPLDKVGEDDRGATFIFDNARTGQLIVAHRKAGSVSGRHYHKGTSPYKNPEKILLMRGEATLNWKFVLGSESGSEHVVGPSMIDIAPNVWHEVVALTDFVMLELNSLEDGNRDTYRLDS